MGSTPRDPYYRSPDGMMELWSYLCGRCRRGWVDSDKRRAGRDPRCPWCGAERAYTYRRHP